MFRTLEAMSSQFHYTCRLGLMHVCSSTAILILTTHIRTLHLLYLFIILGVRFLFMTRLWDCTWCAFSFCDAVVGHDDYHPLPVTLLRLLDCSG